MMVAAAEPVSGRESLDLTQFGLTDVGLMDGERVDTVLDLASPREVVLLTPTRLVHVRGNGRRRKAEFALVDNVDSVETGFESEGNGVYGWAAAAFVIAVLLYFMIEHAVLQIAAPVLVALLGVYLIADHKITPGCPVIVFKAGAAQLRCELSRKHDANEVSGFINRLFEIKTNEREGPAKEAVRFALR